MVQQDQRQQVSLQQESTMSMQAEVRLTSGYFKLVRQIRRVWQ
jgi:hypothetical protein